MEKIRSSKISKVLAIYLSLQLMLTIIQPTVLWASTSGPSQPEFNSFTPIGTSDMVNLSSGDFNYNIPIMDVGGYPLNLSYNSGITTDKEASWVGLGWNLNVGQIARQVRGIPDDFKGDEILYENDSKDNITVGTNLNINLALFGFDEIPGGVGLGLGLGVQYNNYDGISFRPSFGPSFSIGDEVKANANLNFSLSTTQGATVSPSIGISKRIEDKANYAVYNASGNVGLGFNSRKGLENMSLSVAAKKAQSSLLKTLLKWDPDITKGNTGGSISFNDQSYTPIRRAGVANGNFTFSAGIGTTFFGFEVDPRITGFGSFQKIREEEKKKDIPAFGYEHTEANEGSNGVLDFNRENDRTFTKNTTVLPTTNYTYDIYAIQGQGALGQFRPFRSQTSYIYDREVTDYGNGANLGVEFGVGNLIHAGVDIKVSPSITSTGKWTDKNYARSKFVEKESDINRIDYEPVYFQTIGELSIDTEPGIFKDQLHSNDAMKIALGGSRYNRKSLPKYNVKTNNLDGTSTYNNSNITSKIKRTKRLKRTQSIHKITHKEAEHDKFVEFRKGDDFVKDYHTAGIKVLKPDGSTYVFGETVYNTKKVEATFDMSGSTNINCATGLIADVGPQSDPRNSSKSKKSDEFLNRITTPAYAHTYLLTSVLSSDYEDIDNNGPSVNDLGSYTDFIYKDAEADYKWRIPYDTNEASYNEGLKSKDNDQKGNYIYGEKEIKYLDRIETKTHVAYFKLIDREDGLGALGETSNVSSAKRQKAIDKIYLFTRPEFEVFRTELESVTDLDDPSHEELAKAAIKVSYFEYDYTLCQGVPNNSVFPYNENGGGQVDNLGGKLTLKRVYFTYRGSNMGKYTPYIFNYENNPEYNLKDHDVWGNYKKNIGDQDCSLSNAPTTAEFPYTTQTKTAADLNAKAWSLTSIDLPSGGKMEIETEADEYQYVQDRKVMQLFNITGAGDNSDPNATEVNNSKLYNGREHSKFLYVKISDAELEISNTEFKEDYLGDQIGKPIQFRALLNMTNSSWQYDYVAGYFELDTDAINNIDKCTTIENGNTYAVLPLKYLKKEGGFINSNKDVNPIAKAGWYFGRTYLNKEVYSLGGNSTSTDFVSIVSDLVSSLGSVTEIFTGPNGKLQEKGVARKFKSEKSWVRLLNPTKRKLGGGLRVAKIMLYDNWDSMTQKEGDEYKQFYGQEYSYNNEDGNSSGVATFEPVTSRENPFIEPVNDTSETARDKLVAPKESNYTEKPFGASFFPSPQVTYGRIEVRNLQRGADEDALKVRKHATGKVVSEFYTSFDYPTITDYTDIAPFYNDESSALSSLFNISVKNHLTFSQGFVIETNDMNGRMKTQRVYAEGQNSAISGVDYIYSVNEDQSLKSTLPTIDKSGVVKDDQVLGVHYDVVNDFRESYSKSETFGVDTNLGSFLVLFFPGIIPSFFPKYAVHEDVLRTAVTTKIIHKTGILEEKIAYDVGAKVSTKNLAWDAETGQVILTKTVNEYDQQYYNFSYPAYWNYKGMGQASANIGVEGYLEPSESEFELFDVTTVASTDPIVGTLPFYPGDMLSTIIKVDGIEEHELVWVAGIVGNQVKLMNKEGYIINEECSEFTKGSSKFKIIRSGYKNTQMAAMASVTSLVNPIDVNGDIDDPLGDGYNHLDDETFNTTSVINANPKIINASAVRYNDYWKPQDQLGLPRLEQEALDRFNDIYNPSSNPDELPVTAYGFNPYLYNARGEWRAIESYAYLTGRASNITTNNEPSLQNDGYFTAFSPFYKLNGTDWEIDPNNWTTASTVTQFSPYGAELENKDALNRYSSAVYGYAYTLPTAVASNSQYKETAFDGFEDYDFNTDFNESPSAILDETEVEFKRDHFSLKKLSPATENNGAISNEQAHTGVYSYKVTGNEVELSKGLTPYLYDFKQYGCFNSDEQVGVDFVSTSISFESATSDNSSDSNRTCAQRFFNEKFTCTISGDRFQKIIAYYYIDYDLRIDNSSVTVELDPQIDVLAYGILNGDEDNEHVYFEDMLAFEGDFSAFDSYETILQVRAGQNSEITLDNTGHAKLEVYLKVDDWMCVGTSNHINLYNHAGINVNLKVFLYDEFGQSIDPSNSDGMELRIYKNDLD